MSEYEFRKDLKNFIIELQDVLHNAKIFEDICDTKHDIKCYERGLVLLKERLKELESKNDRAT